MPEDVSSRKEPWLAVNLSLLVPGLGQFYARAWAAGDGLAATGKPYIVPPGFFFVAGDNSARSFDSRYAEPIPNENVIGKARKR